MVPLPMLKLETKSDSFGLSLVDVLIDVPVGNKRSWSSSGSAGVCHISYNATKEKEQQVTIIATFKTLIAL